MVGSGRGGQAGRINVSIKGVLWVGRGGGGGQRPYIRQRMHSALNL